MEAENGYLVERHLVFEDGGVRDLATDRVSWPGLYKIAWTAGSKTLSATYSFSARDKGARHEPRGVCLVGNRVGPKRDKEHNPHLPPALEARFPDLDGLKGEALARYVRSFNQELRNEIKVLEDLGHLKNFLACLLPNEKTPARLVDPLHAEMRVLLCEHSPGKSLRRWRREHAETLTLPDWFELARQIIETVHRLHLYNVPHGYICPDNIILDESHALPPKLINLEWDPPDPTVHVEGLKNKDRAKLRWRRPYDSPDKLCYYRDESDSPSIRTPFVPGDVYSLGLTLLFLATGKDGPGETLCPFQDERPWEGAAPLGRLPWNEVTEPILKSNERVKAEVFNRLKDVYFRKSGECQYRNVISATEVIFACLRVRQNQFYNARSIRDVLDRFPCNEASAKIVDARSLGVDLAGDCADRADSSPSIKCAINTLCRSLREDPDINMPVARLYEDLLNHHIAPLLDEARVKRFTVGWSREEIIDGLCGLFLSLGEDWTCRALTTPTFWFDKNCGASGRVTSALKIAASKGCKVDVLILLDELRMNVPAVAHVMDQHKRTEAELRYLLDESKQRKYGIKMDLARAVEQYKFRWCALLAPDYREFLRFYEVSLAISRKRADKQSVLVIPDFSSEDGHIIALRVFPILNPTEKRWHDLNRKIDECLCDSSELSEFQHR